MKKQGLFITFEGSEGSGKSTQADLVYKYLKAKKKKVLHIREPGGVVISEAIRKILLDVKNKNMSDISETLLYMAARAQLVHEVIVPALKKGTIVLCDRFLDSTVVYQGYGNGVDIDFIKCVGAQVTQRISPDLTLIFDIDTRQGLSRNKTAKDRIELRSIQYHNRVRRGYWQLARQEPKRVKLIKVNGTKEEVQKIVRRWVDKVVR